ncbi:MAG: DMT family transporter [Cyanobacteria bacterium P01_H01_bin.35]
MTKQLELASEEKIRTTRAIVAIIGALIILAFMPIFIRVSESEISPNATVFNFSWIGTVFLLLWNGLLALKSRGSVNSKPIEQSPYTPKNLVFLLATGLFTTAIGALWSWSLVKTSVANSELLHSITPLFAVLGGAIFLGQKFDRSFVIGVGIALAGAVGIGLDDISIAPSKLEGDGLAILSAIFWAVSLLIQEKLRTHFSATTIVLWCSALSTLFILPIILVSGDRLFPYSGSSWLSAIFIGLGGVLNMILTAYSLKWLSSGLVSTILLLNPTLTAILAWAIFSETLSLLNLLGFVVILLGIYLVISSEGGVKTT